MGEVMDPYRKFDIAYGFNRFQEQAVRFAKYEPAAAVWYPALGLGGEAGEYQEKVKKIYRDKKGVISEEDRAAMAKELGDVLWYVSASARDLGVSLGEIAVNAIMKLEDREARGVIHGSGDNR